MLEPAERYRVTKRLSWPYPQLARFLVKFSLLGESAAAILLEARARAAWRRGKKTAGSVSAGEEWIEGREEDDCEP